jgi:hypothetical protein
MWKLCHPVAIMPSLSKLAETVPCLLQGLLAVRLATY